MQLGEKESFFHAEISSGCGAASMEILRCANKMLTIIPISINS